MKFNKKNSGMVKDYFYKNSRATLIGATPTYKGRDICYDS